MGDNHITNNEAGIWLESPQFNFDFTIGVNSIYGNEGLGIVFGVPPAIHPNGTSINFPVITSVVPGATTTTIGGYWDFFSPGTVQGGTVNFYTEPGVLEETSLAVRRGTDVHRKHRRRWRRPHDLLVRRARRHHERGRHRRDFVHHLCAVLLLPGRRRVRDLQGQHTVLPAPAVLDQPGEREPGGRRRDRDLRDQPRRRRRGDDRWPAGRQPEHRLDRRKSTRRRRRCPPEPSPT